GLRAAADVCRVARPVHGCCTTELRPERAWARDGLFATGRSMVLFRAALSCRKHGRGGYLARLAGRTSEERRACCLELHDSPYVGASPRGFDERASEQAYVFGMVAASTTPAVSRAGASEPLLARSSSRAHPRVRVRTRSNTPAAAS